MIVSSAARLPVCVGHVGPGGDRVLGAVGPLEYPDESTLLKGNNSNGPVVLAERTSGRAAVVDAIRDALAPYRTVSGRYRIETEWRYVTAKA